MVGASLIVRAGAGVPGRFAVVAAFAVALLGCAPPRVPQSAAEPSADPARGAPAARIAVTAHPLATRAALRMLDAGGSAVDAAIAAQMVLGLVEPQSSGIGGGSVLLYWDARKRTVTSLDGLAAAPSRTTAGLRIDTDGATLPADRVATGGRAVGVPGTLAVLELAHRRYGKLAWSRLFEPAVEIAEQGFGLPFYLHSILAMPGARDTHAEFATLYFGPDGAPLPPGAIVRNPAYAGTMRSLARLGARRWLVQGGARAIADAARRGAYPGLLEEHDLLAYRAVERAPVCGPFLVYRVCTMAPPSFGGVVVLQVLQMLEALGPARYDLDDAEFAHFYAEAGRLAQLDRRRWIGDPDHVAVPVTGLLEREYLRERARSIDAGRAMARPAAGTPAGGDRSDFRTDPHDPVSATSQIVIADADGNVLSLTTTINLNFGARLLVDGFVLNNAMTNFSAPSGGAGAGLANAMAPRKRPITSMAPTIAFDARGEPVVAGGSAGGGPIVDYVASGLIDLLAAGRTPVQALARGHLSTAAPGRVQLEAGTAAQALAPALRAKGHEVESARLLSGMGFIQRRDGGWIGAADPRRDGVAGSMIIR